VALSGTVANVAVQLFVPEAALCACGNLPSSRTMTSVTVDPAAAEAVPLTVIERPEAAAEVTEIDGGSVSANGCPLKNVHSRSLALGPFGFANSPCLSPTQ
jgi:hypothetical protein